ncbi:hypothetical protein Pelo_9783 [Pelomyxa schiedti]|nr:hypothetical protein Pelo_9783 [Pelomyxa schiedti]
MEQDRETRYQVDAAKVRATEDSYVRAVADQAKDENTQDEKQDDPTAVERPLTLPPTSELIQPRGVPPCDFSMSEAEFHRHLYLRQLYLAQTFNQLNPLQNASLPQPSSDVDETLANRRDVPHETLLTPAPPKQRAAWEHRPCIRFNGNEYPVVYSTLLDSLYYREDLVCAFFGVSNVKTQIRYCWEDPLMLKLSKHKTSSPSIGMLSDFTELHSLGVVPPGCHHVVLLSLSGIQMLSFKYEDDNKKHWQAALKNGIVNTISMLKGLEELRIEHILRDYSLHKVILFPTEGLSPNVIWRSNADNEAFPWLRNDTQMKKTDTPVQSPPTSVLVAGTTEVHAPACADLVWAATQNPSSTQTPHLHHHHARQCDHDSPRTLPTSTSSSTSEQHGDPNTLVEQQTNEEQPEKIQQPTAVTPIPSGLSSGNYACDCGRAFKSSQAKAGHCHFCPVHLSMRTTTRTKKLHKPRDQTLILESESLSDESAYPTEAVFPSLLCNKPISSNAAPLQTDSQQFADTQRSSSQVPVRIACSEKEGEKVYQCACGKIFSSSQSKAGHCHFCKGHMGAKRAHALSVQSSPSPEELPLATPPKRSRVDLYSNGDNQEPPLETSAPSQVLQESTQPQTTVLVVPSQPDSDQCTKSAVEQEQAISLAKVQQQLKEATEQIGTLQKRVTTTEQEYISLCKENTSLTRDKAMLTDTLQSLFSISKGLSEQLRQTNHAQKAQISSLPAPNNNSHVKPSAVASNFPIIAQPPHNSSIPSPLGALAALAALTAQPPFAIERPGTNTNTNSNNSTFTTTTPTPNTTSITTAASPLGAAASLRGPSATPLQPTLNKQPPSKTAERPATTAPPPPIFTPPLPQQPAPSPSSASSLLSLAPFTFAPTPAIIADTIHLKPRVPKGRHMAR